MPPSSLKPPIEPMLAKIADELPQGEGFLFEPKWDGFRALVFRQGDDVLHDRARETGVIGLRDQLKRVAGMANDHGKFADRTNPIER